jgi:GNAT superfamily N-acetyltransferase
MAVRPWCDPARQLDSFVWFIGRRGCCRASPRRASLSNLAAKARVGRPVSVSGRILIGECEDLTDREMKSSQEESALRCHHRRTIARVIVRPEEPDDRAAITAATEAAFGRTTEARMVDAIRASEGFVPALSLVADECGKILGHVILSYVALDTGQRLLELGPLSVFPERQGQGIGGDLVRTALGLLTS